MQLLITGGAGFIRTNLRRLALAQAYDVVVLGDLSKGHRDHLTGLELTFVEGCIPDRNTLEAAVECAISVLHLPACGAVPRCLPDSLDSHQSTRFLKAGV